MPTRDKYVCTFICTTQDSNAVLLSGEVVLAEFTKGKIVELEVIKGVHQGKNVTVTLQDFKTHFAKAN